MPSVSELAQLPTYLQIRIPISWQDQNGHVNIQYYMKMYCDAGWPMMGRLGLDERYFLEEKNGFFDLEHHLFYLAELHVGEEADVRFRLLGHSAKRFHAMMFIVNTSRHLLAGTFEFITSGANLSTRRAEEFPPAVQRRLSALEQEHARLAWAPPVCGIMSS